MKFLITIPLLKLQQSNTRTSDVQVLASHANHLLAREELLGHDGGKTAHGVSTAINHDFLFEHVYARLPFAPIPSTPNFTNELLTKRTLLCHTLPGMSRIGIPRMREIGALSTLSTIDCGRATLCICACCFTHLGSTASLVPLLLRYLFELGISPFRLSLTP